MLNKGHIGILYFKTKAHLTFSYIQAMFNATRPWLLLITVITDKRSNFLSAISFN